MARLAVALKGVNFIIYLIELNLFIKEKYIDHIIVSKSYRGANGFKNWLY